MAPRTAVFVFASTVLVAASCQHETPPGAPDERAASSGAAPVAGNPTLPEELRPKSVADASAATRPSEDAGSATAKAEHGGPWLAITAPAAAIYSVRDFDQKAKLGYVRNGGKVAVKDKPVPGKGCSAGWYDVVGGGYVCASLGTTDLNHPQVKNGTPLYRSVPSREQMAKYEPYLAEAKAKKAKEEREKAEQANAEKAEKEGSETREASLAADPSLSDQDGGAPAADAGPPEPWWQRADAKEKLHEITLDKLKEDSDDILALRMVAGFYIAVDKTFSWNGRTWYKSTKGLIAPADRFWLTQGSKFHGVELDGNEWQLPIAWVYGGRKTAPSYEIDTERKKTKPAKPIEAFTPIALTGREIEISGIVYSETRAGPWVKNIHVRFTRPGEPPKDIKDGERWVDVNLKQQTLVVFEGTRALYATLISSGKESAIKEKDHATPTGSWRVREKHVTTTMDGDGTAAGDLPYSIEDVPYVMYFHNSFALHGAFWHKNFGVEMSHGCVNLAPLDAKWVFQHTDPPLPEGWHGAWATAERPGSLVVIHE
jgi:lipoprotein-anchoring transpeptidase ErfK/SrfK